jgi:hypothetical protein
LRSGPEIVAAVQVRIARLKGTGLGAAYVRWGPLWRRRESAEERKVYRDALRALRNEYVCRRGLVLRIFPCLYGKSAQGFAELLSEEGFAPVPNESGGSTLVADLSVPVEEVRRRMEQKWRNCLNQAERNNLAVVSGADETLFAAFIGLYRELLERKRFREPNDINDFRRVQLVLPPGWKMQVFLCGVNREYSAGAIFAAIGDTGIYLFGATNDRGMADKGSYLLQWRGLQWMKERGCTRYNLNGVNQAKNPGGYHFKAGLAGKNCETVDYLGRFDCYPGVVTKGLARAADSVLPALRRLLVG